MEDGSRVITDGAAGVISRVEELAYELTIAEVMTRDVKSVTPGVKMGEVLDPLGALRVICLPDGQMGPAKRNPQKLPGCPGAKKWMEQPSCGGIR